MNSGERLTVPAPLVGSVVVHEHHLKVYTRIPTSIQITRIKHEHHTQQMGVKTNRPSLIMHAKIVENNMELRTWTHDIKKQNNKEPFQDQGHSKLWVWSGDLELLSYMATILNRILTIILSFSSKALLTDCDHFVQVSDFITIQQHMSNYHSNSLNQTW